MDLQIIIFSLVVERLCGQNRSMGACVSDALTNPEVDDVEDDIPWPPESFVSAC